MASNEPRAYVTSERWAKGNIRLQGDTRGGLKHFYAESYLDILREHDWITEDQLNAAKNFWTLRDSSMRQLATKTTSIFRDCLDDDDFEAEEESGAEPGASQEIWLLLNKRMTKQSVELLKTCCNAANEASRMWVMWAFTEGQVRKSFDELLVALPNAREEYSSKCGDE